MMSNLKKTMVATGLVTLMTGVALAAAGSKDPTKYDCREVVGYRTVNNGNKPPLRVPVYECPHKDKRAAGKCETHWLWGMRCKD